MGLTNTALYGTIQPCSPACLWVHRELSVYSISVSQYALRPPFLWFSVTSGFSCREPNRLDNDRDDNVKDCKRAFVFSRAGSDLACACGSPLPKHDYDNCLLNHVDKPALADPGLPTCQERRDVGFMRVERVRSDEVLPVFNTFSSPNVLTPRFTHNIEAHYLSALLAVHYRTIPVPGTLPTIVDGSTKADPNHVARLATAEGPMRAPYAHGSWWATSVTGKTLLRHSEEGATTTASTMVSNPQYGPVVRRERFRCPSFGRTSLPGSTKGSTKHLDDTGHTAKSSVVPKTRHIRVLRGCLGVTLATSPFNP
ncbi:hypothetical protein EDB85DRAFT_2280270 [Lactarius pseudohatsudake]|nr:hypothetical protein EDB85DRAFT_2281185 [Lactarius pseudohatsudake]KAH9012700.1 hypothetical protein EDB85DRAFT_2281154 [Lactarius pseudohatsudake]KAH9015563.1 hypothetical protein EDB85DRAFT_2280270 [Lactarius pseudohatsudake]